MCSLSLFNAFISSNYEQLGLKFKLFSAEVLFNKGLSQIYLGRVEEGLLDLEEARKEKQTEEHNVIDDAITDRGEGYTVFSIVSDNIDLLDDGTQSFPNV